MIYHYYFLEIYPQNVTSEHASEEGLTFVTQLNSSVQFKIIAQSTNIPEIKYWFYLTLINF